MKDVQPKNVRVVRSLRVHYFDGQYLYGARGLKIVRSADRGHTWEDIARLKMAFPYSLAPLFRPVQRLFRAEIYKMHRSGDSLVALAKGGVYAGSIHSGKLELSHAVVRGSRPISLAVGPDQSVFFGEYHMNQERGPIRIYGSKDLKAWSVVYEFPAGEIRHIHGIFYDKYAQCFWLLVGDFGREPGIAKCSLDFSEIHFVRRGQQNVRVVSLICRPEGLLFATDSELEPNAVYFMDRDGTSMKKLHAMESSTFHVGLFGEWKMFGTVTEPSKTNDSSTVHIWGTADQQTWHRFAQYNKDYWPFLFQFGTVFFPEGETEKLNEVIYSGTAVDAIDNYTVFAPLPS